MDSKNFVRIFYGFSKNCDISFSSFDYIDKSNLVGHLWNLVFNILLNFYMIGRKLLALMINKTLIPINYQFSVPKSSPSSNLLLLAYGSDPLQLA